MTASAAASGTTPGSAAAAAAAAAAAGTPNTDSNPGSRVSPDQDESPYSISIGTRNATVLGNMCLIHAHGLRAACLNYFTAIDNFLAAGPEIQGFVAGRISDIQITGEEPYYKISLKIGDQHFEAHVTEGSHERITFISTENLANRVIFKVDTALQSADTPQTLRLALSIAFKDAFFEAYSADEWMRTSNYQEFSITPDLAKGTYALFYDEENTCFTLTDPTGKVDKQPAKEDGEQAYKFSNGLCFKTTSSFKKSDGWTNQITFDISTF